MSDFLIYAARLQDAGISDLWVSLGSDKDGTRLMHVSLNNAGEVGARFPTRTFELCGTDRVLERIKDDMLYSDAMTPERLQAEIDAHPLQADDLRVWFADWLLSEEPTEADLTEAEEGVVSASVERTMEHMKGVMRGLDIARRRDAMQRPNVGAADQDVAARGDGITPDPNSSAQGRSEVQR